MRIRTTARDTVVDGVALKWKSLHGPILRILGAILQARADGVRPPSTRELMDLTGLGSQTGVILHLRRLKKLGLICWNPSHARTLVATCKAELAKQIGETDA